MTQYMHVHGFMKRATSKMNRSTHTLSRLMSMLRVWLEAGKKQLRSSLEAGKRQSGVRLVPNEITARRQRGYGSSLTRLRLVIIMLLALMTFGATNALAQTDYSGVYCIANNNQGNFLGNGNDGNFYLCPSQEYYNAGSVSPTDNGLPFFTTYQTKQDANSLWVFEKVDGQNYYTIKLYGTNKYITVNDALTGYGKAHRKRIHLEELAELSDRNYFEITPIHEIDGVSGVSISCLDKYKSGNNKYFNPAGGNQPSYTSTNNKENPWSGGMVGFFTIGKTSGDDRGSVWFLEVPKPTITYDDETGNVTITAVGDITIRYAFDGESPTSTSGEIYSTSISMAGHTSIKAIAVRTSDSKVSGVATMDMIDFTYHILTLDKTVAAQATKKQPAGMPFSGYINLPAAIQSPYISDETITFYTMEGDYVPANIDTEHKITATPDESANIYVTYTTDKLGQKFLHFQGARPFNFKNSSGQYLYDNGTTVVAETDAEKNAQSYVTDRNYLWYFYGSDPYNIQIRNANSNKYLTISGSTPARSDDAVPFFLTAQSGEGTTSRHITLKNVSNGETIELNINTVVLPLSYTLIDRKNNVIERDIAYSDADGWGLPDAWKSPVVDYHYWNADAFVQTVSGTPDEPFVFNGSPTEITTATEATNNVIYVTYTLKSDNTIDLDGRNILKTEGKKDGATYRLKFTGGQTFNQEDGLDGVSESPTKAVYPYSNGDASLYVYGEDQWTTQLASGASTRSRWLWYLEPAKGVLDPYHVRVSSYQNQTNYTDPDTKKVVTNFHSYLRTYKPEGYSGVVTGVTNNNPLAHGGEASDPAITDLPAGSEYMLLGTDLNHLKLVTVDAIDGSRRTVNSFEQYWKNSPTVQGKLTTKVQTAGRNVTLEPAQKGEITGWGWHVYKEFANSAPWMHNGDDGYTTSKKFLKEEHAYQTISMGETFSLVETAIDPMLILLDQHGWEIARIRLPSGPDDPKRAERYAAIHKYSSPMVARYHFWKTGSKVPGYHKYKVSDYATVSATDPTEYTADELGRADITKSSPNLPNYESQALVGGKERDWYVTYDVKTEYTSAYTGAATEGGTSSVPYLVKQGGHYAKNDGNILKPTTASEEDGLTIENAPTNLRWYVKPNFDIDAEMGYLYAGETGAQEDAKSKAETELDYFDHTREGAVPSWSNGFDPYNVQIQSVSNTERYFTANTTGSTVTSSWEGTSSSISLLNMGVKQPGVIGLDQTKMKITNATFMVLDDGNGNMRLVPRFDNTKVMQDFTTLAAPAAAAAADDQGTGEQTIFLTKLPTVVNSSSEIKVMGGTYLLSSTFSATGSIGTKDAPFTGTIEGQIGSSFDVSAPFIAYTEDAVIKNVIIESSSISSGNDDGHAGAIVATATGNTRIYNCGVNGGSVSGTNYVGGIVGLLDGSARVINCYSYADITGGSTVGGIVGYNNYASTSSDLKTMVMNCMFYGDITGGTSKAPIYNGKIISNVGSTGLGNYNYFLAEQPYVQNTEINTYNCALMAEERFLNRFEFFRLLMNSHLELAGWYATGNYEKSEMMKWVLETADRTIANPKPYPVLKTQGYYPSIINYDAKHAPRNASVGRNKGVQLGTLSVTINQGSGAPTGATITNGSLTLTRTDKDFDHFNFNYDKVQLPYYNDVGTGNYTKNKVVTGWKITSISGGTAGSYTTGDDATTDGEGNITETPYNFADRNYTNKDLSGTGGSNRVFNQGAYWDVPEGVTAITIEPYWAEAVYLADSHADVVYNESMTTPNNVSVGGGQKYTNGKEYSIAGDNQKVYTSMDEARKKITTGKTVYDCAIVLVGNAHNIGVPSNNVNESYTIMSADFDHDNEPDYSYILRFNGRTECHPVRTDFVNIPGLGMAQKSTGGTGSYNFGILIPKGWFESTNTSLFRFTQFEYEHSSHPADAPLILQGGVMEQWVSNNQKGTSNKIPYIHVGGNVWFKEFHTGCHQDKQIATKHSPISVTGGDYDEFYLTGLYRGDITNKGDNAECYINGGRFGTVCGAAMEGIGNANGGNNTGNIVWQIQNADIHEFYAGGLNAAKPVTGNLSTTITDSYVDIFCGGPKFGDMSANKTVHTKATGCTFGTYFGAGYGGNSYSRLAPKNHNSIINFPHNDNQAGNHASWNAWLEAYYKQEYNATYGGVSTQFDYQFLPMSDNTSNVARIFVDFVKFSLATTRNVTSNLTGCTVTGNFYGGGSLGKVDGNVTSTLTDCNVKGSVFGAGFSASLPTVEVDSLGFRTEPYYFVNTGTYRTGVKGKTTTYTWQHANTVDKTANAIDKTNHILYTTEDLTTLGTVTGKATLNITGNTLVEGFVFDASGNPTTQIGGVFGGGDSSAALGDTEVNIDASGVKAGSTYNAYNVFGGGNIARVGGTTTVNVNSGKVNQRVFGGGNEADVNTNANVVMSGGTVLQGVYGGCNTCGTIGGNTTVTLTGGTVGTSWTTPVPDPLPDVVFGGGLGEPTLVNGDVTVNVGTMTPATPPAEPTYNGNIIIYGNVYGGSALGNTSASKTGSDPMEFHADKTTKVNLYAGTINGSAFGGGLGRKAAAAVLYTAEDAEVIAGTKNVGDVKTEAVTAVESFVGGDVNVLLDGAKVQQVFGCNNLNGTPKGHVKVLVERTNNFSGNNDYKNNSTTELDARTTYDVTAVYGGGNQADYIPVDPTPETQLNDTEDYAEVIIRGCGATSIEYVYGGGNAAAVPATQVTVESAYIIHQLFGGGNGKSTATFTNPGANIGLYNNGATEYGTGKTKIELIGGQVHEVYGGSNTLGNVRGGTSLKRSESNTCTLKIGAIYGAGQEAPMDGNVNIVLECMPEEYVAQVFGGAKNAEINGDVSLTVTSGKYGQVFGGNNIGGSINGSITVNVYEDGCKPLIIGELYGGGFKAPYSVFGCTREGDTWTAKESGTTYYKTDTQDDRDNIQVNVYSCTSIGKIFGGGYQAPVIGNTHVWVNMMKGLVDDPTLDDPGHRKVNPIGKIARIFGGGNDAVIKGNTLVDIGTVTALDHYDPKTPTEDIGVNIESGNYLKPVKDENNSEENETLTAGIYGGGNAADVEGNTTLNIGTANQKVGGEPSIKIQSDIFGGGFGESTHVTGNVTVNIGKKTKTTVDETTTYSYEGYAIITGDVYGGSAKGKVNSTDNGSTKVNFYGGIIKDTETPSGKGNIYGGGLGEDNEGTENDHAADVNGPVTVTLEKGSTTNTVVNNVFGCNNVLGTPKNTVTVNINGGTVNHSVYGGGNRAAYTPTVELAENAKIYPAVNINNGTITENVFGGGLGTTATVTGNPHVTIGDTNGNHTAAVGGSVYGGGDAGDIHGNTLVKVLNTNTTIAKNVFGAGKGRDDTFTCAEAMVGEEESGNACVEPDAEGYKDKGTKVVINNGTIGTLSEGTLVEGTGNVYGGGEIGRVEWNTQVEIGVGTGSGTFAPVIEGCVFGAGKGLETHGYAALVRGNSYVTIGGDAKIGKNVYGGGEISTVGRYWVKDIPVTPCEGEEVPTAPTDLPAGMPYLMRRGGKSVVTIQEKAAIGYHGVAEDAGHVFGAGRGINPHFVASGEGQSKKMNNNNELVGFDSEAAYLEFLETLALVSRSSVTINGCDIKGNVYGGSESGFVQTNSSVTIKGNSKIGTEGSTTYGNVFGGGKGLESFAEAGKVRGETVVDISDGKIYNNVYGGGQRGYVMQNVTVNVRGGQVVNDVYGGGALANTNTDNWNTTGSAIEYVPVAPSEFSPTYSIKEVAAGNSVEGLYTYNSSTSEYVAAHGVAVKGTTYYQYVSGSSVAGYYTRSVSEPYVYTLVPSGSAAGGTTYYKKKVVGDWNSTHPYTTTVKLTGGVIGNAYGGGLGSTTVAANVYGDVKVTVNKPDEMSSTGGSGIAFTRNTVTVTYGEGDKRKEYIIPVTGRVFGCNNINGTPTGNVEVEVYGTRQIEINGQDNYTLYPIAGDGSEHSPNGHNKYYEVQAVYGGGNLSDYLPATGKATSVYITGCDSTSIEKVYGGGNSAVVPSSNVVINGSYDIGTAFGGGNGGDLVQKNGTWYENDGAIVIGKALIKPKGGKVGEIFGGSDAKGYCGNPIIDKTEHNDLCPLVVTRMYGAGKESDVDNVDIVISGCTAGNTEIEYVFGGSYNAHIAGYINLTISAGVFKNVFGGNDRTGSIGGNITVNIEETEDCEKPLIIQNLFGGGNEAAYPGTRRNGTEITTPGKITVNVKSATRIDNVFGGSFKADVNGDTEVNINMTKGFWAGKTYQGNLIPDSVGVIGNIYGGGNQGVVRGNSKVNICTADSVGYKTIPAHLSYREKDGLYYVPVTGARITGDVFGGGSEANVNGNDTVNICTADYSGIAGFQGVAISRGSVYGGGSAGDVLGNTFVTMSGSHLVGGKYVHDAYVYDGVYGGGLMGSVGTFTRDSTVTTESNGYNHSLHKANCLGKPVSCKVGTGKCTVIISGGQVGPIEVATKGMKNVGGDGPVDVGFVFGAGRGEIEDPDVDKDADFHTYVNATEVIIKNKYEAGKESVADSLSYVVSKPIIMASVYGGGENGRVLDSTYVKIYGGQIGSGDTETAGGKTVPRIYTETEWATADSTVFKECLSWDYKAPFLPYDPYAAVGEKEDSIIGTDGHTYYGSVFGGGSGYFPYKKANGTHAWLRSAGQVFGNTRIDITAGHILTSVYGGNETTDVGTYTKNDKGFPIVWSSGGKCTINMVGGTIGVPRSVQRMKDHPVTCYLFGAGKGDQRTSFNTWTNVQETEVNVSGTARIFGSIFGGGEDGHILGNAKVNIGDNVTIGGTTYTAQSGLKIGTTGTSYVDGNVFGGGRGFSGVALTAGSTGGNVEVNIKGGTMLGSIYGGGRLASVGIGFTPPEDLYYGQLIDDVDENHNGTMEPSELKHGHITINISGANTVIGNGTTETGAGHPISGNVFGGSMGRLTLLDNVTRIPLWPKQSVTKEATVNISGGTIWNSVYGGSELGIVRNRATVNVSGTADIRGNVFGGGYGSDEQDKKTISAGGYASIPTVYYTFTPMIWTGCVSGDTYVNISGGKIGKSVYGGGNFASVGLMNFNSSEDGSTYNYITKHNTTNGFGLSWPYEFQYIQAAPTDDAPGGKAIGGKTNVNITGGRIGTTVDTDNAGFVYGGSKGQVSFNKADNTTHITDIDEQVYAEAFCANVRETEITINYASTPESDDGSTTPCIVRTVYGGGEDGHVMENAVVNLQQGWIGRTLFGGGKGASTYKGTKYVYNGSSWTLTDNQDIHSWTAGKVYGNTTVTIEGGKVGWFVYGGGNMASVGKGNYAGGADDYSKAGYGEKIAGNLWTSAYNPEAAISESNKPDDAYYFLNSGKTTVNLFGGTIGIATAGFNDDGIPYGSVFGGSRGTAALETSDVATPSPLYNHIPEYYLGYVNKTVVNVGGTSTSDLSANTPTIYGSIYGGAQDGHVRNSTEVKIFKGSVAGQKSDTYGRSGHVFGAGSGIGKYTDPSDSKNKINSSSGSVTCTTLVELNDGSIAGNIYGGGALSSVGPLKIGDKNEQHAASDSHKSFSKTQVDIKGGSVGGSVFGAGRGPGDAYYKSQFIDQGIDYDKTKFATDIWSDVTVSGGTIGNNVYGGGQGGIVKESTTVSLTGGSVAHNAYGGGQGTKYIAADIFGNTTTELNNNNSGRDVDGTKKGCIVDKIFGCNDLNGTPKGHVLVHVYGTQNRDKDDMQTKVGPGSRTSLDRGESEGYIEYMERLIALAKDGGVVKPGITASVITAAQATITGKVEESLTDGEKTAISNEAKNVIAELQNLQGYDVTAVYGGGDLAPYVPAIDEDQTEVIIEGCGTTSIKQVYGGGNAAYVPATNVLVKSAYVIDELFGGGNGLDNYVKDGKWYENPGANVGYKQLAYYDTGGSHGDGDTEETKYTAITYTEPDATTPEGRKANYPIGTGIASTTVNGGYIHNVYGGSNKKGNIRAEALLQVEQAGTCTLITDKTYAGSKEATIDAETNTVLDCVKDGGEIYGGSQNADILNDVHIRITNGSYTKVFGGNEKAGTISGSITIDIEERGCTPIEIDELYAGGYLAPYSIYGYEAVGVPAVDKDGNPITDKEGHQLTQRKPLKKGDTGALATPFRDPQINIISATRIGKIYGGGYQADLIGSPHVNVNMTKGRIIKKYASDYPDITDEDAEGNKILPLGAIGTIYGGGFKGDVVGDTHVEIGTGEWLNFNGLRETTDADGTVYTYNTTTKKWDWTKKVGDTTTSGTADTKPAPARNAATITGNVFGGGEGEALESGEDAFYCKSAMVGVVDTEEGSTSVTIANGTVGTLDNESKLVAGTGNVYGGGKIGRVEMNTVVTIGVEDATGVGTKFRPTVLGSVFGAGKGVETHGYSALVRGNSTVTIQGVAKVGQSVYGGGEKASIGRYHVAETDEEAAAHGVEKGMPYSLLSDNSGSCTVIVRDSAEVGPNDMIMTRAGGPDNSGHVFGAGQGVNPYEGYSSENKPWRMTIGGTKEIYNTATAADTLLYLKYVESLGLATQTDVTIGGNSFVKGDVFGGAEQGFVQHDTKVTIQDNCQIGGGYVQMNDAGEYLVSPYSLNRRYTPTEWADGRLYKDGESNYQHSLPECASWRYESPYAAHDKYAGTAGYDSKGGATTATNGSTFYGNVFGGGSGYFPYAPGKWHWKAGNVGGNTVVNITGGHILTNVYGGNELTNVEGSVTVNFGGTATLGVPRTLGQIAAHPVTCYLFGAGKGDPRVLFNKQTNVKNARVNVTGGTIYGSVFGGGEDGHVLRNDTVIIGNDDHTGPTIGTWGTSYVDGNIFGGGRGFAGDAYTAGNVAGSVTMNIKGGTMLGSIYGGGRLGSVGYGLYEATETEAATGHKMYGEMQDDGWGDWYMNESDEYTRDEDETFKRGHITINISGGTIGNTREYIIPTEANITALNTDLGETLNTDFTQWSASNWTTWQKYYNVPSTTYDISDGKLHHTRGGNVYAGGMGRRLNLAGVPITMEREGINWLKLGNVKSTKLTITGGTIKSNVYGGGEFGAVRGNHMVTGEALSTELSITGGTIGTEILDTSAPGETKPVVYTYGSVFGGGTGTTDDVAMTDPVLKADTLGAYVTDSTRVTLTNAIVKASVFGGGELAAVGGSTHVTVSGNTKIGRGEVWAKDSDMHGYVRYGSWRMGNVYGGGRGSEAAAIAGLVEGNTNVLITGGNVYHNVYGGGALGSVGRFYVSETPQGNMPKGLPYWTIGPGGASGGNTGIATVTITGGQIGISGRDNGMVFGSSRGDISTPTGSPAVDQYDRVAWVRGTVVNIGTKGTAVNSDDYLTKPLIKGSVYGGGENGHNYQNANVNVYSGTIGIADKIPGTSDNDPWWNFNNDSINKYVRAYRGNVYGAGSGTDTYKIDGKPYNNPRAGMVGGSTIVNIAGGHIGRSVYGAGAMASVGNVTNVRDTLDVSKDGTGTAKHADVATGFALSWPYKLEFAPMTGKATVNVTGGHIGTPDTDGGDVYGSARGVAGDRYATAHMAYVKETEVNINYPTTIDMTSVTAIQNDFTKQCITGSVHGSGENGFVYDDTKVTLTSGLIGHSLYGAGKGKGTYKQSLLKIGATKGSEDPNDYYEADIYSLIAGKVFGNTYVTMNGGHVGRNVYGGGNMGSVGKGNFAGGTDDYVNDNNIGAVGYGEKNEGKLWTSEAAGDDAWEFLHSGKTTVKVLGGIVGYIDANPSVSMKNELPYGNVFGGSAGEAAPNVADVSNLYLYSPAFFSGYVNETDVTIGTSGQVTDADAGTAGKAPKILGSVYGGGQDGHVRRDTKVTVYSGEIGMPYNTTNQGILQTDNIDDPQWMHRGNVYGGGSGITEYHADTLKMYAARYPVGDRIPASGYSNSSGSVTRFTEVNVKGGTIHRNVYGGGSNGSVGAPNMRQSYVPYQKGDTAHGPGYKSQNTVNIGGGTNVAIIGTPTGYNKTYGGEVYGACRGISGLDPEQFANSIWTKVNIFDKATIRGNVYGGGDNGIVKKDAEVRIGDPTPVTP